MSSEIYMSRISDRRALMAFMVACFAVCVMCSVVTASPVRQAQVVLTQPDGTSFSAVMSGDEVSRIFQTPSGYTIAQDDAGWWCYATLSESGELTGSVMRVTAIDPVWLPMEKNLLPSAEATARAQERRRMIRRDLLQVRRDVVTVQRSTASTSVSETTSVSASTSGSRSAATTSGSAPRMISEDGSIGARATEPVRGPHRILVVMVDFPEDASVAHNYQAADFQQHFFSEGERETGSVTDYYRELSYGQYELTGTVVGWVTAPNSQRYYAANASGTGSNYPQNSRGLVVHIIQQIDEVIDFSQYDLDGNGTVEGFAILFKGYASGSSTRLWPHAWALNSFRYQVDGVYVNPYVIVPELDSSGAMDPIGTLAHEWGHIFGVPDMYDYDSGSLKLVDNNEHPVQSWSLMAIGNYGYGADGVSSSSPAYMSGFERWYWGGWLEATDITASGTFSISSIGATKTQALYRIPLNASGTEYLMLENRTVTDTQLFSRRDADNEPFDDGLLVMHVDEAMLVEPEDSFFNDGTPRRAHYGLAVLDAGAPADVSVAPYEMRSDATFSAEDGQTVIGPDSSPVNTNAYDGTRGPRLYDISASGPVMTFSVEKDGGTAPPLTMTLELDKSIYHVGETHALALTAIGEGQYDVYIGLVCPDGAYYCLDGSGQLGPINVLFPYALNATAPTALLRVLVFIGEIPTSIAKGQPFTWTMIAMPAGVAPFQGTDGLVITKSWQVE